MNWYAVDFETSNQNRYTCDIDRVCVLSNKVKQDFRDRNGESGILGRIALEELMASPHPKVMHNVGFDLHIMENRLGIPVKGEIHDTYLMAKHYKNDLPAYDLKSLAWLFFGDTYQPLLKLREWIHKHNMKGEEDIDFDMTKPPDKLVHNYCMHDVKITKMLAEFLYPKVKDNYAYQQDTEVIRVNMKTENNGITLDMPYLKDLVRRGNRRIKRNTKQATEMLKPEGKKSPTGEALRKYLKELGSTEKTKTDLMKADEVVLRRFKGDAAIRSVTRIKKDQKTVNTYAKNLLTVAEGFGSFHPNLVQSSAITRRYRSWNMYGDNGLVVKGQTMNIPRGRGIRDSFITPEGYLFSKIDLASIEARIGSHAMSVFLGEDWFCEQYRKNDKFNIYIYVGEECSGSGKISKKDNIYTAYKHGCLGVQYGVGVDTFYKTMHDKFELPYTHDECANVYKNIKKRFPVFSALQRAVSSLIDQQGYVLDDFGAIYYLPSRERYKGVNYYCQGCAGNVFKWWMLKVDKLMEGTGDYMFNFVHDEINSAISMKEGKKKANARVRGYCESLKGLELFNLPIVAEPSDLCRTWAQAG